MLYNSRDGHRDDIFVDKPTTRAAGHKPLGTFGIDFGTVSELTCRPRMIITDIASGPEVGEEKTYNGFLHCEETLIYSQSF